MTRRTLLTSACSASALALSGIIDGAPGQTRSSNEGLEPDERNAMSDLAYSFMAKNQIPGLAVAIARDGEIAYSEGFGLANKAFATPVTPSHLFRIASISKPITSIAIFQLIEQGRLTLADRVFGADGILPDYDLAIDDQWLREITIDHLLTHTAGGWTNDKHDPMFSQLGMDHRQLIAWTLANVPLLQPPGTKFAYSNFGYCVLGRVIERKTGQSYADALSHSVLRPIQVEGMRIAGNTLRQRLDDEVVYYRQQGDRDPYSMNVARMDSHGGWLASPLDLARLIAKFEGGVLKPETVSTMTTPSAVNPGYARGWFLTGRNRWHTGGLPGTSAVMMVTPSGFRWVALANSRVNAQELDRTVWRMIQQVKSWTAALADRTVRDH